MSIFKRIFFDFPVQPMRSIVDAGDFFLVGLLRFAADFRARLAMAHIRSSSAAPSSSSWLRP